MIKHIKINIGKELTGEITNWQPGTSITAFGYYSRTQFKNESIFDGTTNNTIQYLMINRIKIFADIHFEIPAVLLNKVLRPRNRAMRALAFSSRVRIIYETLFKDRFKNIHK